MCNCPVCGTELSDGAYRCGECREPVSLEYVKEQASSLYRQWEFYENLTWRIPTMTVTVNAGFFVLIGVVFKAQMWDTFKPVCGVLMCAIGALTVLYGYRLYRASRLAQKIICELRDRFDNTRGVEGVVRTTRDLKCELSRYGRFSSRNAMAYAFTIWGAFEAVAGLVCLIAFGLC